MADTEDALEAALEMERKRTADALAALRQIRGEVYASVERLAELSAAASAITTEVGIMLQVFRSALDKAITEEANG